jgi:SAM-dependent methyltransferase
MAPWQRPTPEAERKRYDLHQNNPADPGYRQFLEQFLKPLVERLSPGAAGLDFGSGPYPLLQEMLNETGFPVQIYDPFYAANPEMLEQSYDFITASEVVEHLHYPRREFDRLWKLLKPGGLLGIMTGLHDEHTVFSRWHYISDPTHVAFFSPVTFTWLAERWQASLEIVPPNMVFLQKPS